MVAPSRRTPLVMLRMLLAAGGSHGPPDRPGLAALTAALVDEGTEARSSLELAAAIERLGGYLSSSADWDSCRVDVEVLARDLDTALALLAEVVMTPAFPESEVERLRHQTIAHLRRRAAQPATVARDVLAKAVYGNQPYGWPLSGTEPSVGTLEREDVLHFYRRHGVPRGSTLLVVGDVETRAVESLVDQAFAVWDGTPAPPPRRQRPAATDDLRVLLVNRPDAPQSEICLGHSGLPRSHPDWVAATAMNGVLGGKFTSRLNLNLRERLALTYGAASGFAGRRDAGPFEVTTAVANHGVGTAVRESLAEMRRLQDEPVPAAELRETIDYLIGSFPYTCETLSGVASRLRDLALFDLPLDHYAALPAALAGLTSAEVQRCAQRHLHPQKATVVVVGPAAEIEGQLRPLAPVERIGEAHP